MKKWKKERNNDMKLLYNLTKEQMADVYEEYQDYLYKGDIEAVFENLENTDDIKLTDEEMERAVTLLKNDLEADVCYSDYARSALAVVLEERTEKLKEKINHIENVIKQVNS